jgi:hypothetical protein
VKRNRCGANVRSLLGESSDGVKVIAPNRETEVMLLSSDDESDVAVHHILDSSNDVKMY